MPNGEVINLNPSELTIEEMEDFEEAAGMSWSAAFKTVKVADPESKTGFREEVDFPAKALRAVVWVLKRKDNPDFTLEEAGKTRVAALKITGSTVPPTAKSA